MKQSSSKPVAIWLLTGCFLIFCMVIIGGITRLTGSGLSITEWKPIMGAVPPLNEEQWQTAFDKYKAIPQFQKINYDFTLGDFKSIFWWEFIHRLLGRVIGIVFLVPFFWFLFKGMLDKVMIRKSLLLFFLGALLASIGWFMVKSGLSERTSVSHIWLAIHLNTAFITYGFTLYFALELLLKNKSGLADNWFRSFAKFLFGVVIIQIIYGAFVAGMHAGKIYNTFPLMNGKIIPDGLSYMDPSWINFFDNQVTVQFIHRLLAGLIVVLSIILFYKARKEKISRDKKKVIVFFVVAVAVQFILGVITLLTKTEITLAVLHQAGAFLLFSGCVWLVYTFRRLKIEN